MSKRRGYAWDLAYDAWDARKKREVYVDDLFKSYDYYEALRSANMNTDGCSSYQVYLYDSVFSQFRVKYTTSKYASEQNALLAIPKTFLPDGATILLRNMQTGHISKYTISYPPTPAPTFERCNG